MVLEMEQEKVSTLIEKSNLPYPGKTYSDVVKNCPQVVDVIGNCNPTLPTTQAYMEESPEADQSGGGLPAPPLVTEENLRFNLRNAHNMMERVDEKALAAAKKRDIEGTIHSPNSFETLSNPELMLRAVKMRVQIPDNDFASIDILRELEKCRNAENINTNEQHHDREGGKLHWSMEKGTGHL